MLRREIDPGESIRGFTDGSQRIGARRASERQRGQIVVPVGDDLRVRLDREFRRDDA